MKRSFIKMAVVLLLSSTALLFCVFNSKTKDFFELNVESLAAGESIPLLCNTNSPIIICSAFCRSCGTLWTVPGISGQYINGSSRCICGASL